MEVSTFYFFTCFVPSVCYLSFLCSVLFLSSFNPNSWCDLLSTTQLFPQGQVTESKHRVTGWKKRASLWIAPMLTWEFTQSCLQRICAGHRAGLQGKFSGRQRKSAFWLPGGAWCLPLPSSLPPYWLQHLQTLLEEDHQLRDTWIVIVACLGWELSVFGFWCSRVNLERTLETDPRPGFQGSRELNSAGTDRTVAFKATERLALHLSVIWLTSELLASWQVTRFCHLFLIHVFTLLQ